MDSKDIFKKQPKQANNKFYFIEEKLDLVTDELDKIKALIKRFPKIYYLAVDVLSPVYADFKKINKFLNAENGIIINLGSGNKRIGQGILNLDFLAYENVDIVADIHNLPFIDNSVDCIVSIAVLEHVQNPKVVIEEIFRTLKPGGMIISVVPFMQPFHASPHDYQRYTLPGLEHLHIKFTKVESGVISGPISGFLWVFQETIAIMMSFGNEKIRSIIYLLLLPVTFPLKYFDILFNRYSNATVAASNHYYIGRK
jgi:SAM-dependent methyltransferase